MGENGRGSVNGFWPAWPRPPRAARLATAVIHLAANIPIANLSFLFLMAGGGSYLLTLDRLTGACNQIFSRSKYGRGGRSEVPGNRTSGPLGSLTFAKP